MVNIFLVEDEFYALAALKQKIIDLNSNYQVIGTAANGTEALQALETMKPDILLTDIRMPDMDGITLITKIREKNLPVIPVIISGYQEFEYAKQAVRLGVQDYLLKPVNPSELSDCLKRCIERLTASISQKSIFSFLIGNESFRLEALTDCDSFTVCYLIFSNALSNFENIIHPNMPVIPCETVQHIFESNLTSSGQIFCFKGIFSNELVLILENTSSLCPFTMQESSKIAAQLTEAAHTYVTLYYVSGDGAAFSRSIQTARNGAVRSMMFGQTRIVCQIPEHDAPAENLNEYVDLFSLLLQQKEAVLLRSNIHRMFSQWLERHHTLSTIQTDLIFILNSLKRNFSDKKFYDFDSVFFIENLICFSLDQEQLADHFTRLLLELFHFQQQADLSAEHLVSRIEDYFCKNLTANISLQDLADELNVSKVYLCRIFKKYKDTTPIDYFTRMKINRAQELIRQFPGLSLRDISESLGFNDVYYFSKVFKKIHGVPPSEIRKPGK